MGLKRLRSKQSSHQNAKESVNMQPDKVRKLISNNLSDNLTHIRETFANCYDLQILNWRYGPELAHTAFSVYFSSLVGQKQLNYMKESLQDLVTYQVGPATTISPEDVINFFDQHGVSAQSAILIDDMEQAIKDVTKGHIIIFFNQWNKALSYAAASVEMRQVSEPITESVVQGPHDSTVENLEKNIGMLRYRIRNPRFKMEVFQAGEMGTDVAFGYYEGAVNPETLVEFKKRIEKVKDLEILETSYIEELMEDSTYSPFPQYRFTERPDTAVAALFDGKIIVMVAGTPSIMLCPGLFVEFLHSAEDYYQRTVFSNLIRFLRMIAFFLALTLPSIYIALSTIHPELLPTILLLTILDTREGIPFPAFVEALIMEFFFELLREAGLRLPRPIGSSVSIVGALIIGEAAITAGIASPIMVVVVALTGIASFSLPQYSMAIALRTLRFPLMILAASLGGFGLMIGYLLIFLHMTTLRSLGQPYLSPIAPLHFQQLRDVQIRAPLKTLLRSPRSRQMQSRPRK